MRDSVSHICTREIVMACRNRRRLIYSRLRAQCRILKSGTVVDDCQYGMARLWPSHFPFETCRDSCSGRHEVQPGILIDLQAKFVLPRKPFRQTHPYPHFLLWNRFLVAEILKNPPRGILRFKPVRVLQQSLGSPPCGEPLGNGQAFASHSANQRRQTHSNSASLGKG